MNITYPNSKSINAQYFYKALSVKERYDLFKQTNYDLNKIHITEKEINNILKSWKANSLLSDEKLEEKLSSYGLTSDEFCKVLKVSDDDQWINNIDKKFRPQWIKYVEQALELNRQYPIEPFKQLDISLAFRPFCLWFKEKLSKYLGIHSDLNKMIVQEALLSSLIHNLIQGLNNIGARTIVLELHIAKKLNELEGTTPEQRYESFIHKKLLPSQSIEFIYQEYPVLARALMTKTMYYYDVVIEFLNRYQKDYEKIKNSFIEDTIRLTSLSAGIGDSHQKGRTVMRLKFENDKEIIYKPKSLAIVKHFNNLLEWMNQKGFTSTLKSYRSIDQGSYTWEECVIPEECQTKEQVENYYKRLGGYLAVIYILNGTDFHHENVMANGEYPLLIDLETLFHHVPDLKIPETAEVKAKLEAVNSVLGTALLPMLFYKAVDGRGVDISGVSGENQELPIPLLQVENDGSDEIRFVRKTAMTGLHTQNVPKLHNKLAPAGDFVEHIVKGFKEAANIIIENKGDLLVEHGPLTSFKDVEIRIVNRPTQYYGNFLLEANHPNYMKDWLDKEKLLDRLWFTVLDRRPIPYEIESLAEGDIPMFVTKPSSYDLVSSNDDIISNYYEKTSYDACIEKIQNFSIEDINKQVKWIEASLITNNPKHEKIQETYNVGNYIKTYREKLDTEKMINEAKKIGDNLEKSAIYSSYGDVSWIGLETNYYGQWQVSALDKGLYNGLSGIGLFLAYLGKVTNEQKYHDLAKKVERSILLAPVNDKSLISAFYGKASNLYMLSHFNKIYGENQERKEYIEKVLSNIQLNVKEDKLFDLLGGSAGTIQILLNLYEQTQNEQALHIAILCGEHLVENKVVTPEGTGWPSVTDPKPLGGFSHGTSGIAWSLLRLYHFTNNQSFYDIAIDAIKYDQSLFDEDARNWKDLRCSDYNCNEHSATWCHGSAGIGLSRIMYLPFLKKSDIIADIETGIKTTLEMGMGKSHSLCHGDLGNSELLLQASQALSRPDLYELAQSIGMNVINYYKEHGQYKTGVNGHVELPGMMLGLSGIGYQLLRLATPKVVPSILTLN
ncbi:type 2 lantipeptide synthetase LanM family protein [Priestia megaterium]|jgi:type 2 lantibiotic biosynthesis protein LanM|uniref:type 2 lanthipeptide synthetase LanM family protein n=1 Tax=Priestia megaterium TaxID=1404 RepID=UPI002283022C|nr:type 2 lanthipeptide synthetase LanM family protein [Priestia megaterium]MCY9020607.1 type 2 lantipeptide synthetase LanM family protein [Priestia megaterium]